MSRFRFVDKAFPVRIPRLPPARCSFEKKRHISRKSGRGEKGHSLLCSYLRRRRKANPAKDSRESVAVVGSGTQVEEISNPNSLRP